MQLDLAGRVFAITGASRGIGLAIARGLAAEGAAVAIAARSPADLAQAHAAIEAEGGRCLAYACDLAVPGEAAAFVDAVVETFGRLDGLVCAAGQAEGHARLDDDRATWEANVAIALLHPLEALQAAVPALAGHGGSVLFIAASHSDTVRGLAGELASRSVRINAIAPGQATAEATAGLAVVLLSPRAQSVNGVTLSLDGAQGGRAGRGVP